MYTFIPTCTWVNLRGVVANVMNCSLKVSKFELQSRYYIHFQINTRGKGMKPYILPI